MRSITKAVTRRVCAGGAALMLAACSSTSMFPPSRTGSPTGSGSLSRLRFSLNDINGSFSAMPALRPLASKGKGSIAVILPEDPTAPHFAELDAPYLSDSFQGAGLTTSQFTVQNAPASKQFSDVQKAIANGATVLIVDARYSGAGVQIESYAKTRGVRVIDYDWLTLGGSRNYYVGFDSLKVGVLLGQGLVSCATAWGVKKPQVIVMKGAATDYNVALYLQGYDAVLGRQFSDGWKRVVTPAGTWDQPTALSEFQQQYTAHHNINAALIPNDENAAPIIHYLQGKGIKAKTFPTTGLDATLGGLQDILSWYQCGTVYKPIYLEAQAAAALAMYVRAGITPPRSLRNWQITDPKTKASVPSVLLTPEWVTAKNINSTVIADKFVPFSQLCSGRYATACSASGIWPVFPASCPRCLVAEAQRRVARALHDG